MFEDRGVGAEHDRNAPRPGGARGGADLRERLAHLDLDLRREHSRARAARACR
jgi:hypothetical protein